jgi:KaiC/GvpD/RAD55 family RecA-like ATPase
VTFTDVLSQLNDKRPCGTGQWLARCPAHDDISPSLSITEREGKTLMYCHAGCSIEAITTALGVPMKDLFTENGPKETPGRIEKVYSYVDELGSVLYQAVRYEPKGFKQRRPDANGGWIWNLKDTQRVFYRLPIVLQEMDAPIIFHEGEKAVEAALEARLPGCHTTTVGGSKAPRQTDFSPVKGRHVIICPDNDTPGEVYLRDIAKMAIAAGASSVKILRLQGLPPKGDVVEWLQAGGTAEQFAALLEQAEPIEATPPAPKLSDALVSYAGLLALNLPDRPRHLAWLPEGGNAMVHGPRGVGKTFFQLTLATALTTGQVFLKWPVTAPVGVLYVDGEMQADELRNRTTALLERPPVASLEFLTSQLVYQKCEQDLVLTSEAVRNEITAMLDARRDLGVLILDNISCLFSGINEDSKQDWEPINAWLIRLRHRGLATVLVHHSGKSGQQRGTSGREDSLDAVIQLTKPTGADAREGCHFELQFTKCRSVTGDDVAPLDVRLQTVGGRLQWQWQPVEQSIQERARQLFAEGVTGPTELAEELGINKGYASRILKKLRAEVAL